MTSQYLLGVPGSEDEVDSSPCKSPVAGRSCGGKAGTHERGLCQGRGTQRPPSQAFILEQGGCGRGVGVQGTPASTPTPQAMDRGRSTSDRRSKLGPGGRGPLNGGVAITAGSVVEVEESRTLASCAITRAPGEERFGDRWVWGARRLTAGLLRSFGCPISTDLRTALLASESLLAPWNADNDVSPPNPRDC